MIDLDGIVIKLKFGVNVILGVLLVVVRAAAVELEMFLYRYIGGVNVYVFLLFMFNVLNGGEYVFNIVDF